ncbi:nucleotidyl transferase AbiEii/AbiGii toxin family protein [candidate division KSB1 bacterium]|nr:nucleotidyl transferase AbiEii/AbiGii toxin family protein [candidate division KSB1 bacterium]
MASSNPTSILTPLQSNFLTAFFQHTQDFYLTGGTALSAFYLHHRYSEDLDLFTQNDEAFQAAEAIVNKACLQLEIAFASVRITSYFKHLRVGAPDAPLTLHFSRDYAASIKPANRFGNVLVDSIADITANKICAALGRTEIKDLLDLYFLDQAGYTIPNYFELAQQKDAGLAPETLAYTLSQFQIDAIPAFMIKPVMIADLELFRKNTIAWLIEKSVPAAL